MTGLTILAIMVWVIFTILKVVVVRTVKNEAIKNFAKHLQWGALTIVILTVAGFIN